MRGDSESDAGTRGTGSSPSARSTRSFWLTTAVRMSSLVPFVPTRANPCGLAPFRAVFRRIERSFETRAIRAKSCGLENETWTDRVRFPGHRQP